MELTQDDYLAILGAKELEIIQLRRALSVAQEQISKLTPSNEKTDGDNVVSIA